MYTKVQIFNLALGALLLKRQLIDADTDTGNEANTLRQYYDSALNMTLADLNLNETSVTETLSLVAEDPSEYWLYAYSYPSNCALARRIVSCVRRDDRYSQIPFEVGLYGETTKEKVIFTSQYQADLEFIPNDINTNMFSSPAGLAIAHRLAILSAPILVGKGAAKVKEDLETMYKIFKAQAQEIDKLQGPVIENPEIDSEWVKVRLS